VENAEAGVSCVAPFQIQGKHPCSPTSFQYRRRLGLCHFFSPRFEQRSAPSMNTVMSLSRGEIEGVLSLAKQVEASISLGGQGLHPARGCPGRDPATTLLSPREHGAPETPSGNSRARSWLAGPRRTTLGQLRTSRLDGPGEGKQACFRRAPLAPCARGRKARAKPDHCRPGRTRRGKSRAPPRRGTRQLPASSHARFKMKSSLSRNHTPVASNLEMKDRMPSYMPSALSSSRPRGRRSASSGVEMNLPLSGPPASWRCDNVP